MSAGWLSAAERLSSVAILYDDIGPGRGRLTHLDSVVSAMTFGKRCDRAAVVSVTEIALAAIASVVTHGHDQLGNRWSVDEMDSGYSFLKALGGCVDER